MNFLTSLRQALHHIIMTLTPEPMDIALMPPDQEAHGDLTTPVAFSLAKRLRQSPLSVAQRIAAQLQGVKGVQKVEIAKGGFINITLDPTVWNQVIQAVLAEGVRYGYGHRGQGEKVNVEYVSANPTGPLHAGHGRVAIMGDVIANLLAAVGYQVTKEYYVNDAGRQIALLAQSVYAHYTALFTGTDPMIPEDCYPGEYVREVALALQQVEGDRWIGQSEAVWQGPIGRFAVDFLLQEIRQDLQAIGIQHEVFTSEHAIHASGLMDKVIAFLKSHDLVYTGTLPPPKGQEDTSWQAQPLLLFRSTHFGDDQDRPLKKADGSWTYFAGDIAYHWDKFQRGFSILIDVWGADHASHVTRTRAAVQAVTQGRAQFQTIICQIVNFFNQGVPVKMSKRAGTFITLRDILKEIDPDSLRFMMISKRADTHFDFDFQKAKEETKDNPVFYVQYAHARCRSVLRAAQELFPGFSLQQADLFLLAPNTYPLMKLMADWPRQVDQAALTREPHRLTTFLYTLASAFHALWQQGKAQAHLRFLHPGNPALSYAHLALVQAVAWVIASGLGILGVQPKEELR